MTMSPESLHPIVAQLSPNEEQLPAVRARGSDVVVTAGAGTGKTRTLVARYLSLLAEGRPLRGIVAITFTRKAAREMRNRVRAEVRRYLEERDLPAEEQRAWQAIYADLDAARIGTIHSLCGEILRAHPAEASADPGFRVLDEAQAALLRQQSIDAALAWAADSPAVLPLFTLLETPDALRSVITSLLERQLDVTAALSMLPEDPLPYWRQLLRAERLRRLETLVSSQAWLEAVETLCHAHPADPNDATAVQRQLVLDALAEASILPPRGEASTYLAPHSVAPGDQAQEQIAALGRLADINLVGGSYRAWTGGKSEKDAVKGALRTLRTLWRGAADLLSLELTPIDERLAETMPALRMVFDYACRRYEAAKKESRGVDFDDLEHGAVALLQNHPTVRRRWRSEIDSILIDEFQDTNQRQRDFVRLISGEVEHGEAPGDLFVVGDAKQSIYGFRGADVSVFRRERDRIVEDGGVAWRLATSYRAHRPLVESLNELLRPVLGESSDPSRPWVEPFAPLRAHRDAPLPGVREPYVEFHLTVGSKADGALHRAAGAAVVRLAELIEPCRPPAGSGGAEGLDYGDAAILCRSSSSFDAYENALDDAGLPYVTVAGRGFYDRPEIRDLLNALRAVSDPTDDVALVGLLRSPALGLSDVAVYHLVRSRPTPSEPLWRHLLRGETPLGAPSEERAAQAMDLIARLHGAAGRTSVANLLKVFLDATHYRASLLRAGENRAVRNVDKLLSDAHASELVSVGAFLDYLDGLRESGAREGEARSVAGGAVQIMTVHQAKGLEFPLVVLGDASWSGGPGRHGVLIDDLHGVLLPVKGGEDDRRAALYQLAEERQDDQEAAESKRLLYVAATRAREKLIVSGTLGGIKKDGTPYKLNGWLAQLGRPLGLHEVDIPYDAAGLACRRWALRVDEASAACCVYEPEYPFDAQLDTMLAPQAEPETDDPPVPLPPPLLAPLEARPGEPAGEHLKRPIPLVIPAREGAGPPSWIVGEVTHQALAEWQLPNGPDDTGLKLWIRARARAAGLVGDDQVARTERRVRRLLVGFQRHHLFNEIAGADHRLHEVPYSRYEGRQVDTGKVDLLYRSGSHWTIVEFKTDYVAGETNFQTLLDEEGYLTQVRRYAAAGDQFLGARPRCLLWMLNWGGESRVFSVAEQGPPAPLSEPTSAPGGPGSR